MRYLIANWKSHKNYQTTQAWIDDFFLQISNYPRLKKNLNDNKIKIIVCPPLPFISLFSTKFTKIPNCHVGAQDLSIYGEGNYTGEVSAEALSELVEYTIVGHSERRNYFKESDEMISKKIDRASKMNIKAIQCVRNEKDKIQKQAHMVAYEPIEAIGTGKNASVDDVLNMKKKLDLISDHIFLYGGSVDKSNCEYYLDKDEIDGFLVGGASLDPKSFLDIASLC